jgi:hypothetical protein
LAWDSTLSTLGQSMTLMHAFHDDAVFKDVTTELLGAEWRLSDAMRGAPPDQA